MQKLLYLILIIISFTACKRPTEAPVFKGIGNIEVTRITGSEAFLNANAYFYNPNDVKMKLKKVAVDVIIEGNKIGTVVHSLSTKIPAKEDFKVPLDATFDMKQVGFLQSVLSILGGNKVKVNYKGYIRVAVHGIPIRVPVEYEDEVRL